MNYYDYKLKSEQQEAIRAALRLEQRFNVAILCMAGFGCLVGVPGLCYCLFRLALEAAQ
jgi:hypothetical protein